MFFAAGKTTEFVVEHHSFWTGTTNGVSVTYPDFDIITKLNGTLNGSNKWWCVLSIGQLGQAKYRLIKSNLKAL